MRTLVIGFGNPSRRDDGVALVVVNGLRHGLGLPALDEGDDGYDDLGGQFDTLFLQQLNPELAETLADYDRVVFVDAHVAADSPAPRAGEDLIRRSEIHADADPGLVSHHFRPSRLLALALALYGRTPATELVSIAGFDFDFGSELSLQTAEGARQVTEQLWQTYGQKSPPV